MEGPRTNEDEGAELFRKGTFLLAEKRGHVAASVYVELRGEHGYFGMLAVDPRHQGTGLGRLLIEAAEDHCRTQGCRHMEISVLSLRPELPPLYRKLGYVETGTQAFRPSRPLRAGLTCHCIVMSKKL